MNKELEEDIVALKTLSDAQYHQVCVLENQLAEARRQHESTMRQLNALYAERSLERMERHKEFSRIKRSNRLEKQQ